MPSAQLVATIMRSAAEKNAILDSEANNAFRELANQVISATPAGSETLIKTIVKQSAELEGDAQLRFFDLNCDR